MVNSSPANFRTIAAARPSSRRLRPGSLASGAIHRRAFSLVEVLVVMTLLSIIVLALMQVFTTTQRAFRAGVTQTDVLEGSRAAVDLISSDLRSMTASGGYSNAVTGPVNFFALDNNYYGLPSLGYWPLIQSLPGTGTQRSRPHQFARLLLPAEPPEYEMDRRRLCGKLHQYRFALSALPFLCRNEHLGVAAGHVQCFYRHH